MSNFVYIVLDSPCAPLLLERVLRAAKEDGVEIFESQPIVPGSTPQFVFHPGTSHAVALEEVEHGRCFVLDGAMEDVADVAVRLIELLEPNWNGTLCDGAYTWSLAIEPSLTRVDIVQAAQRALP